MRLVGLAQPVRWVSSLRPTSIMDRRLPLFVGGLVVAASLLVFLGAGWPLLGWAAGAGLWAVAQLIGATLAAFFGRTLVGSGVVAIGLSARGILIGFAVVGLAAADPTLALAGLGIYAVAYGVELTFTLALYF